MRKDLYNEFGDRLKFIREKKGISQGKLAEKSGVSRPYITQLENGFKTNVSLDTLRKLADALGVRLDSLMK